MGLLVRLIDLAFDIYFFIIIAHVLISWLIAFEVLNANNPQARNLITLLKKATDPVFKPLQKYIPPIGGIDVTPIIVILGLSIIKGIVMDVLIG